MSDRPTPPGAGDVARRAATARRRLGVVAEGRDDEGQEGPRGRTAAAGTEAISDAGTGPVDTPRAVAGTGRLAWYARRLGRMSPEEVAWRLEDRLRQEVWARRHFSPERPPKAVPVADRRGPIVPAVDLSAVPLSCREAVVGTAEELCRGRGEVLGILRHDLDDPDWSLDPISGRRFPADRSAFRIDYRRPTDQRQVKQVWELSRHQHVTVLAAAWRLTGDERYAAKGADHLRSWWAHNPVCSGVNWTSGIELGIRLISWVWTRRLLDGWASAPVLFEQNPVAVHQIYWHQRRLEAFPSRGSSANNHVIAEAAGLLVAACGFPWFAESYRWRSTGAALLQRELVRNTFPSGVNREQAFEYHGLVAELALLAAAEAEAAGAPLDPGTWELMGRMLDVAAAVLDEAGRPPRAGDGDDGRALVVDDPRADRWRSLLAAGAAIVGPCPWWPAAGGDVRSTLLAGLVGAAGPTGRQVEPGRRPAGRPSHFGDAGLTLLRSPAGAPDEIWCRCDGGPHGYLSIGAHGHADALSVEVRVGGVELLVDPGTYCYQGDPVWRQYFRSTRAHNTLEIDGQDQSVAGGPFLWTRQASTDVLEVPVEGIGPDGRQWWSAEHDGYRRLVPPAVHRRTVSLDDARRSVRIDDRVLTEGDGSHHLRLAFHVGPAVTVILRGWRATLRWHRSDGAAEATLLLPMELSWAAHRGECDPPLGWYSPRFGRKEPITTLVGTGHLSACRLRTELRVGRPSGLSGRSAVG